MSASHPTLVEFDRLVGAWTTEATHPATGDLVIHGSATFEWLEGGWFLVHRATNEHPDFPDSLWVIGRSSDSDAHGDDDQRADEDVAVQYFDSRGVRRVYRGSMHDGTWSSVRFEEGFDQRIVVRVGEDPDTLHLESQLRRDGVTWVDDLAMTYRRVSART
ncbi:MAG: uncharacterized protein JWL76_1323 [Thermoleophilia bacterium]|nr:uncharacterized protein [Thermoleophilia bacterium]